MGAEKASAYDDCIIDPIDGLNLHNQLDG